MTMKEMTAIIEKMIAEGKPLYGMALDLAIDMAIDEQEKREG